MFAKFIHFFPFVQKMCEINYIAQLVETFLMMTFFDGEILSVYAIRKISKISIFRP